jgi:hypothetical protein
MNIDLKIPIVRSLCCIPIVFLVSFGILSITKPSYITQISNEGGNNINLYLLVIYSTLFSTITATTVFLLSTTNTNPKQISFNSKVYQPNIYSPA